MYSKKILLFIVSFCFILLYSGCGGSEEVVWLDWPEALEATEAADKKVVVFIHLPGCDVCDRMREETFGHPVIADYLNRYFHVVDFSGLYEGTIPLKDHDWTFIKDGDSGYHQLALALTDAQDYIDYPSTVLLNEEMERISFVSGELAPSELEMLLNYVNTDSFWETPPEEYKENFIGKIPKEE